MAQIPLVGAKKLTEAADRVIGFPTFWACKILVLAIVIQMEVGNFLAHIVHYC